MRSFNNNQNSRRTIGIFRLPCLVVFAISTACTAPAGECIEGGLCFDEPNALDEDDSAQDGGKGDEGGDGADGPWDAPDDDGGPQDQDTLPCAVRDALAIHCGECHGEQPAFGAPMPLATYEDLAVPSLSDPARSVSVTGRVN